MNDQTSVALLKNPAVAITDESLGAEVPSFNSILPYGLHGTCWVGRDPQSSSSPTQLCTGHPQDSGHVPFSQYCPLSVFRISSLSLHCTWIESRWNVNGRFYLISLRAWWHVMDLHFNNIWNDILNCLDNFIKQETRNTMSVFEG